MHLVEIIRDFFSNLKLFIYFKEKTQHTIKAGPFPQMYVYHDYSILHYTETLLFEDMCSYFTL